MSGAVDNDTNTLEEAESTAEPEESSTTCNVDEDEDKTEADVPAIPATDEDNYDTDLETEDVGSKPYRSMTAEDVYVKACEQNGVVPVSYFVAHMFDEAMNMSHHGLGPNGTKAIAAPLVVNTSIVDLNLEDNWISAEGMKEISAMLMENCYISSLNIAGNKLATEGARFVCEMIQENTNLRELNVSRNDFKDSDAQYFAESLRQNFRLKVLNLSGNNFCELGGEWMGQAIVNNEAVENLNLSWNHLRRRGALAICAGMKSNITIKCLDLSWNGFADDGAMAMGVALKSNNTLTWLDLSNNRISEKAFIITVEKLKTCEKSAAMLAKGLEINDTLKTLKIGSNPLGNLGSISLIKAMLKNENSAMEELDIKGIQVNEEFLTLAQELKEKAGFSGGSKANFFVTLNKTDISSHAAKSRHFPVVATGDSMQVIQKFLEDKRLRLVDLFRNFDKDLNWKITPSEFKKGILDAGIPLNKAQLAELMRNLDTDVDGKVNYSEFLTGRKDAILRRRERLRKEAKLKAKKKQETEKFMSSWHNAVRTATTPRTSLGPTPNHTPLRSRSLVDTSKQPSSGKENELLLQAATILRGEKAAYLTSKSFVETSSTRLGNNMNSAATFGSQSSFDGCENRNSSSNDFLEVSINVPETKVVNQSNAEVTTLSLSADFDQWIHSSGVPNSRKTPLK